MMLRRIAVLIVLFLSWSWAANASTGIAERVFATRLVNGLQVILLEQHKAPVVTFQVWYRVGSRNEAFGKTGLSHLLEHMMFKGTESVSGEQFTRAIQENGGNFNAFTSKDYTAYFETLSADRIDIAMELEADRMQHLRMREEDFQTERMVVMEERRLRTDDDPQSYLAEQMEAAAFEAQPYHWPIIGWMQDLQRLTLEDAKQYYRTYYVPANALLVIVGDFETDALLPRIEKIFGSIPSGAAPTRYRYDDPPQSGERRITAERQARLPFLLTGYHVPNLGEENSYVLEMIATLLGEGKSSRLYKRLVLQDRLALSTDTQNNLLSVDPSLFVISAVPLPGKTVKDIETVVDEELERLQREPVGTEELEKAKNQLEAWFLFSQDSIFYQAMLLARYEMVSSWKEIDRYLPAIRKVTPEDILRVAKKYLTKSNRTVATLVPIRSNENGSASPRPSLKEGSHGQTEEPS